MALENLSPPAVLRTRPVVPESFLSRAYRPLMLIAMVLELVLLSLIVWQEFRRPVRQGGPIDPPARYVQFGMGPLILDTQTGAVCDSYPTGAQLPGGYPPSSTPQHREVR